MYTPIQFRNDDLTEIFRFCETHSFATVISGGDSGLLINHFPLLVDRSRGPKGTLIGHMARGNPQWKSWQPDTKITSVFSGPDRYISPAWYTDPVNVPTWNYAVVHMTGTARLVQDHDGIESILQALVTKYETEEGSGWKYDLPEDFRRDLTQAIVGFEISVSHIEAKFKLSQNRDDADRLRVIEALSAKTDEPSQSMAALMKAYR